MFETLLLTVCLIGVVLGVLVLKLEDEGEALDGLWTGEIWPSNSLIFGSPVVVEPIVWVSGLSIGSF